MSKFQIIKGITDDLKKAPYVEGKVYFVYNDVAGTDLNIYADIDGVRRKIYNPIIDGLDIVESQLDELYVREDEFSSKVNFELDPLDGTVKLRESIAADETAQTIYESFSNNKINVVTPDKFTQFYLLFYLEMIKDHRVNLIWMNDSEIELSTLQMKANTQTNIITLYAKGNSSMVYGIAGVDTEWTVIELPDLVWRDL